MWKTNWYDVCASRDETDEKNTGGGENPTHDEPDVIESLDEDEKSTIQVIPTKQIFIYISHTKK